MRQYDIVLRDHVRLVSMAADFAARRHAGQTRKGAVREPYLNHLAEVASILAATTPEPDAHLVAAGWLHDTLEDTQVQREELVALFGDDIAALVSAVTDDKSLAKEERKRLQIVNAPHESKRAKALKIADKISNLRSLVLSPPENWDAQRMLDYVGWAEQVIAGCRGHFEDLDMLFDETVSSAKQHLAAALAEPKQEKTYDSDRQCGAMTP